MINRTLLAREGKANYKLLLIFMAVLTLYSSMIIAMFDPKLGESLSSMAESMPDIFAAFGMLNASATLLEFITNYLYGFLLLAFPLVFIILLSIRLVARYVDRGSMAYLLATPNKRVKIALTQAVGMALGLLLLVIYVMSVCMALGGMLFPGELDFKKFLLLNIGWLGMLLFLGGICFASSCLFNEARFSTGIGAGVCIAFLLIQMVSNVGDRFEFLKYLTPLTLFDPQRVVTGDSMFLWSAAILYVGGLLFFGIGVFAFSKRDLPL